MHVLVCQHGAEIRPALERGAQVHHVALISQRRAKRSVEIGHSDEAVDRVTAPSQMIEPAREKDREPSVAVDVGAGPNRLDISGKIRSSKVLTMSLDRLGCYRSRRSSLATYTWMRRPTPRSTAGTAT